MISKEIRTYFILIGVPALVLGLCGLKMLVNENERRRDADRRSAEVTARHVSDSLRGMVSDIQRSLLDRVAEISPEQAVSQLRVMAEDEPLVRNVFVWRKGLGVLWPEGESATADEKLFLSRYALLFNGGANWELSKTEDIDTRPYAVQSFDFSRTQVKSQLRARPTGHRSGWNPWFEGNQLCLLGWVTDDAGQTVRGVEIETAALLSHLPEFFSSLDFPETAFAVLDGNSQVILQQGQVAGEPDVEVSLSPQLPHWTLRLWRSGDSATGGGSGFIAVGVIMLALLMVAVFSGGAVLVRDARRQRQDAMQKTSFVSNVSHELKTPLTSIRLYAELLQEGRVEDKALAAKFLGIIVSESKRLSRLVNNVLDFSRLEQGRKKYTLEKVELTAFVTDVIESLRESLGVCGLSVACDFPQDPVVVMADRDALNQILVNLLDNAGKYAASGKTIEVGVRATGGSPVEIAVMDRGPGIDVEHAKRIFERFYRVDGSITASTGGCGLGLGIARLLMRGMGGDVVWKPREGGGSEFVVTFGKGVS